MKRLLFHLSLVLLCLFTLSVSGAVHAAETKADGQVLADKIASFASKAIYNLDEDQLLAVVENFLGENPNIKALTVTESIEQERLLTYFRRNKKAVYGQSIPEELLKLQRFSAISVLDGEKIGTVEIYYATSSAIVLSTEELAWIADHPVISVGIEEWFPFVRLENDGTPGGIAGDFLKLVLDKTGLKIEVISDEWSSLLKDFENGKIDLLPATYYTDERATYGLYSNPYFTAKEFLYIQQGNDTIRSFDDLNGKKLGIVEGYGTIPKIREKFPGIEIVETKNQHASISAVLNGEIDALYESQIVIDDLVRSELMTGLKAIGQTAFKASSLYYFSRIDEPLLQSILTKSLDSISEEERREVINKWVVQSDALTAASEPASEQTGTTWLFVSVVLVFVALLLTALLLPRYITGEKLVDQFGSTRFRIIALVATSLMIVLVAGLVWRALDQNRNIALGTTRENLDVVLKNTMERLDIWVSERQKFLMRLGRDPELVKITKQLLALPIEADALINSEPQKKIRRFFKKNEAEFGKIGFFIIDPNAISIGSGRDSNLGTKNLIADQKPKLLAKAFHGEAVFIPPIRSDVVIGEQSGTASFETKKPLTMFFAVPIRDLNGTVLAVLAQRLLPEGQMSRIMQGGRTGHSGESYLVNVEGMLVTQSRFKNQLIDIGLLGAKGVGQEIQIRDPGGNMLNGYKPKTSVSDLPLTRMAESVLKIGQNRPQTDIDTGHTKRIIDVTDGYRDYRGVPVFGAWAWDKHLGLGVASEVDVEEALAGYYSLRLSFLLITGITLVLTISALLGTLIIGERSTQVMRRARDELEDRVEKRTEDLKFSEMRTRSIIDNASDGIIVIDKRGIVQSFSPSAERIFGYALDEVLGENIKMLMPEPQRSEHDGYLDSYLKTGEAKIVGMNRELVGLRKDGTEFPMDLAVGEALIDNENIFTGIVRDITERKQVEVELIVSKTNAEEATKVAEEATKAKATFLATMSHEIRTPMGGVIGMVDLLQQSKMTDDQRQMINTVGDSAHSLLTIINDILDFSKIEAGKLDLEEIPISIRDVVEGAGEGLAVSARNKNIGLSVYVDPDIPDALVGDQVRLRQILFNFGTNAIKFTEKGKVFLRADKIPSKDKGKATVRFQVIDEGIGIPTESQAKLFQAFSQVDASTTRKFGGTGLGLTICQRLTEIMNGEIGVESVPGEGSAFSATVTFPVSEEHAFKSDGHDLNGLKVLLAHKDDEMRELIPRYLEHWKATVTTTSEIDKLNAMALDAAKDECPFDVIYLGSGWSIDAQADAVRSLQAEKTLSSTRYVVAFRNRIKADRPEIDNTVYVNAGPLRRADLIKSIAIAAGRASPDVEYDDSELMLEPGKAPTVAEAEAAGQLILLAEDNLTNQDVIRRQLTMLGFAVEIANDGKEALELLETRNFSILMTDCHMPNVDGFELTEAIRQSEKNKDSRLPVIAVTASVMKEEIDHCFASGMDDYLAKPLEMAKLKDMLRKWMPESDHDPSKATAEPAAEDLTDEPIASDSGNGGNGAVDPSALKGVFGDDDETFKEILCDFIEPATSNVGEIETGFNDRSADGVAMAAHKLKSSSRSIGANELADLCQTLETAGKAEDWEEIDKAAPHLPNIFQKVVEYIENL